MDKYPELEETYASGNVDADFLKREKELLGDDNDFSQQSPSPEPQDAAEVDEAQQFEKEYPPVQDEQDQQTPATPVSPDLSKSSGVSGPSQFIEEWKVKHQLEVERRDKASEEKQSEIRKKAQESIDDFYANYNTKREESVKKVEEDAKTFVANRDGQNTGSTWDKVAALIDGLGKPAAGVQAADKTRFKELVTSLKGDPDAPGTAGY